MFYIAYLLLRNLKFYVLNSATKQKIQIEIFVSIDLRTNYMYIHTGDMNGWKLLNQIDKIEDKICHIDKNIANDCPCP